MAKILARPAPAEDFGDCLRRIRTARGLTQRDLGRKVGLSQRMVAYYESQGGTASPPLVAQLAHVLDVSSDELVGIKPTRSVGNPQSIVELRLWRKLRQIQQLPDQKRRLLLQLIDEFLADTAT